MAHVVLCIYSKRISSVCHRLSCAKYERSPFVCVCGGGKLFSSHFYFEKSCSSSGTKRKIIEISDDAPTQTRRKRRKTGDTSLKPILIDSDEEDEASHLGKKGKENVQFRKARALRWVC